ncbi:MAG: LamG domain-containing protein, partial [Phycisphaerales bacterium]
DDTKTKKATLPVPADGQIDVDVNQVLSWIPGSGANSHDVYFGTSFEAINEANTLSPEFKGNVSSTSFDPVDLSVNTTYYWRIDERNNYSVNKGEVWNFKTWLQPTLPNLIGWWKFDEGSGNTVSDSAGVHNGTLNGPIWTTGKMDGALDFDGINDYVAVPDSPDLDGMEAITLSAWIYPQGWPNSDGGRIISKRNNNGYSYEFVLDNINNQPTIVAAFYCQNPTTIRSPINCISLNNWYHVVVTNSGTQQKLYINGVEKASGNVVTGPINATSAPLWFGQMSYWPGPFNGLIDDIRIYNQVLTSQEVSIIYNQGAN